MICTLLYSVVLKQPSVIIAQEVVLRAKFDLPSRPFVGKNACTHPLNVPQSTVKAYHLEAFGFCGQVL